MSLFEFCEVYDFPKVDAYRFTRFPRQDSSDFWGLIGQGQYTSRGAKITAIRNPVLRICVKIISNAFFFKAESGSVRDDELWMLFFGVRHLLAEYNVPIELTANYAAILCETFVKVKLNPPKQLFMEIRLQVLGSSRTTIVLLPPSPAITVLLSRENLAFLPSSEHLIPNPAKTAARVPTRRRVSTRVSQPAQAAVASDDEIDEEDPSQAPPSQSWTIPATAYTSTWRYVCTVVVGC
ncbi:uncharacterized protein LOC111829571 [Capsella rubella]|uniref:uncharacterized protein LOC111829571 n=1 Tax=Capsella rubella TaxID=81985 RepID=UPI000CD4BA08|nr:uncharacterized protein LOC111829571 [Capsella rubella]